MSKKGLYRTLLYGTVTACILAVAAGLLAYGLDERAKNSIIREAYEAGTSEYDSSTIERIRGYKARPTVRFFRELGLGDTLALDAILCTAYFQANDIEPALYACSESIRAAEARGLDADALVYNRAMAHLRSAFTRSGALTHAENDLRNVPDVMDAKAYLEAIYLLQASKKEDQMKKREDSEPQSIVPPLFNDNAESGKDSGF